VDADTEAADAADTETGGKKKVSQLFKNTLHKQHYEPEFTMEVDARASDFTYDPIGNKETYESAQSYIEWLTIFCYLVNSVNKSLCFP